MLVTFFDVDNDELIEVEIGVREIIPIVGDKVILPEFHFVTLCPVTLLESALCARSASRGDEEMHNCAYGKESIMFLLESQVSVGQRFRRIGCSREFIRVSESHVYSFKTRRLLLVRGGPANRRKDGNFVILIGGHGYENARKAD